MEQDKELSNSSNKQQKRKRRPRTQANDRNYICSCGKSYLSYPALYTHIKNKHEGKAPGMVQMPRTQKGNKVKKYNFKVEEDDNDQELDKPPAYYIQQFIKFFNCFTSYSDPYDFKSILQKLPAQNSQCLLNAVDQWQNNKVTQQLLQNGAFNTSLDLVFAKFLIILSTKVQKTIFSQVVVLLHIWKKSLRDSMNEIKQQTDNCLNILQIVNDLMKHYFRQNIPSYNHLTEQHYLLNESKPRFMDKCICKFIYLFSRWLFSQKYVNTVIAYNQMAEVLEEQ